MLERTLQARGVGHSLRGYAEALGETDEVGVVETRAYRPSAELELLVAEHVAIRTVVENNRH
ncbi:hypothetical protein D3C83_268910 [compost metagenome]